METTLWDTCPLCHALLPYTAGEEVSCRYCGNRLQVSSSDPTEHDLSEIDPDVDGGSIGVFQLVLHPVGTRVCVICEHIYPAVFECCPRLIDLAFANYQGSYVQLGPKTIERIAEFIRAHPIVVANTVQLRAIQNKNGDLNSFAFAQIRAALDALGMQGLLDGLEDD